MSEAMTDDELNVIQALAASSENDEVLSELAKGYIDRLVAEVRRLQTERDALAKFKARHVMPADLIFADDSPSPHEPEGALVEVCKLPGGLSLYRKANGAGGRAYWSDESADGVFVWDTCLVSESTLLAAVYEEAKENYRRAIEKRKSCPPE